MVVPEVVVVVAVVVVVLLVVVVTVVVAVAAVVVQESELMDEEACRRCFKLCNAFVVDHNKQDIKNKLRQKDAMFLALWKHAQKVQDGVITEPWHDQWLWSVLESGMEMVTKLWYLPLKDFLKLYEKVNPKDAGLQVVYGLTDHDGGDFDAVCARPKDASESPPEGWRLMIFFTRSLLVSKDALLTPEAHYRENQKKLLLDHYMDDRKRKRHPDFAFVLSLRWDDRGNIWDFCV